MKIKIVAPGREFSTVEADICGETTLSEVFNGIRIVTEEGQAFGVCQRGSGLEIIGPDGAMIEVKLNEEEETIVVSHTHNRPDWTGQK